ncbi:peptidoglycan-binding protein [Streptomyces sp. Act143]|uniref:peptidoglycan-binding domain-containing protein n=1 Tax=Streptomyces sp. Act143 TaxID=2200760 RepID=UPI000D6739B8|nr:peptidoglycan-binding domain-containing protein [Streptomyces sp. Act143]PWI18675.1 peptidoglycan-binding protein [Streptomyces sp. Act143]
MAESTGHQCPECGAPRGVDNTPSCGCTQRASDALRDAREAEQAAAEDFDPLRIRPYVDLESEGREPEAPAPVPDATMPLRPISVPPPPSTTDLSLFDTTPEHESAPDEPRSRISRNRRTLVLAAAGALVAVIAAAGLASGLLSYDTPERDTALPKEVRASVPDASTSSARASAQTSAASARPTSAPPSAGESPSASASASPSPSRSSASPTPSASTAPASTPASAAPTSTQNTIGNGQETDPPVLRRGSQGEEVVELELRLTQLGLYTRKAGGRYNEGVEDAVTRYQWARGIKVEQYGVYDLATREALESETTEP